MKKVNNMLSRRAFVAGTASAAAVAAAPGLVRSASAATPFKMATVFALSGPASLFGPTATACAKLAVSQINAKGGILGRQVEIVPLDGGAPPADAAKAVLRAVLRDKVELIVGSHNSAVREAIVATLKGRVPYVYTPLYEGGECAPNTYVTADTPQQQVEPSITALAKSQNLKTYYLIGNDYVWPHKTNDQAKKYIAQTGGKVVGEEYLPLGAPNKFEDAVARIKAAKPDMVVITLVGGDNVNFNRTFAGFGLDKSIKRISYLLEELTLQGIGAKNSGGLFSCMSYFADLKNPANDAFKAAYKKMFGAKAPPLSMLGVDGYSGINFGAALINKAGSIDQAKLMAASNGLEYHTATGTATMTNRHVVKDMYLAECKGTTFDILETFKSVAHGQTCS
jgi:urea transport system substrate-binding protein